MRITRLPQHDQDFINEVRKADAAGESGMALAFARMTPEEKATSLRAHAPESNPQGAITDSVTQAEEIFNRRMNRRIVRFGCWLSPTFRAGIEEQKAYAADLIAFMREMQRQS